MSIYIFSIFYIMMRIHAAYLKHEQKFRTFILSPSRQFGLAAALIIWLSHAAYAPNVTNHLDAHDLKMDELILAQYFQEPAHDYLSEIENFWGYRKLRKQIGQDEAVEVVKLIENSTYPDLVRAIITVESSWSVKALSHMSAIGLMQIRMIAAREVEPDISVKGLYNPVKNVDIGIQIFEDHMHYFDEYANGEHWALTSYNRGRYGTFALNMNPPATRYSRKVLAAKTRIVNS